ncbi:unnamed protein product [Amoebophrya sp. A120]|nr:unnamed protein product [Amoebophrya sp. A120]|eukprot:GSA120T00017025001.1
MDLRTNSLLQDKYKSGSKEQQRLFGEQRRTDFLENAAADKRSRIEQMRRMAFERDADQQRGGSSARQEVDLEDDEDDDDEEFSTISDIIATSQDHDQQLLYDNQDLSSPNGRMPSSSQEPLRTKHRHNYDEDEDDFDFDMHENYGATTSRHNYRNRNNGTYNNARSSSSRNPKSLAATAKNKAKKRFREFSQAFMQPDWLLPAPEVIPADLLGNSSGTTGSSSKNASPGGWFCCVRPEGDRVMIFSDGGHTQIRRRNGTVLQQWFRDTRFPKGQTILDGILDLTAANLGGGDAVLNKDGSTSSSAPIATSSGIIYVVDVLVWADVTFYDAEFEFRHFWLRSRLEEQDWETEMPVVPILLNNGALASGGYQQGNFGGGNQLKNYQQSRNKRRNNRRQQRKKDQQQQFHPGGTTAQDGSNDSWCGPSPLNTGVVAAGGGMEVDEQAGARPAATAANGSYANGHLPGNGNGMTTMIGPCAKPADDPTVAGSGTSNGATSMMANTTSSAESKRAKYFQALATGAIHNRQKDVKNLQMTVDMTHQAQAARGPDERCHSSVTMNDENDLSLSTTATNPPRGTNPLYPLATFSLRLIHQQQLFSLDDLQALYRSAPPYVHDGLQFSHSLGRYTPGLTPLVLTWKDWHCSRFAVDDREEQEYCVLELREDGFLRTSDGLIVAQLPVDKVGVSDDVDGAGAPACPSPIASQDATSCAATADVRRVQMRVGELDPSFAASGGGEDDHDTAEDHMETSVEPENVEEDPAFSHDEVNQLHVTRNRKQNKHFYRIRGMLKPVFQVGSFLKISISAVDRENRRVTVMDFSSSTSQQGGAKKEEHQLPQEGEKQQQHSTVTPTCSSSGITNSMIANARGAVVRKAKIRTYADSWCRIQFQHMLRSRPKDHLFEFLCQQIAAGCGATMA